MRRLSRMMGGIGALAFIVVAGGCDRFQPHHAAPPSAPETSAPASAAGLTVTPPTVAESDVVARVNHAPISTKEVQLHAQTFGIDWTKVPVAERETTRGQLLDHLVRTELMARDAVARGLLRDPDVQGKLWYLLRSFLMQEWVVREEKAARVTQADIEKFYNDNKEYFKIPARLRVRQLVSRTDADAKQALRQLLDGMDFAALAKTQSVAPNAAKGGDLGWVIRSRDKETYSRPGQPLQGEPVFAAAEEVVFALDVGGISQIVKGPGLVGAPEAYYIFQVIEKQPAQAKSLTEVQDEIRVGLTAQRMKERVDELRKAAQVELHPERLKDSDEKKSP